MPRDSLFKAMKRAENAFKRTEFNRHKEPYDTKWPWFWIDPGQSFFVPNYEMTTSQVRAMAFNRTKKSGYEYKVNKKEFGTSVTRVA